MLQRNVRIVIGPYDTVNISREGHKETGARQTLNCALHNLSHLNILNLHELLLKQGLFERQLQDPVKCEVS